MRKREGVHGARLVKGGNAGQLRWEDMVGEVCERVGV
jgi:hypothetical protein